MEKFLLSINIEFYGPFHTHWDWAGWMLKNRSRHVADLPFDYEQVHIEKAFARVFYRFSETFFVLWKERESIR